MQSNGNINKNVVQRVKSNTAQQFDMKASMTASQSSTINNSTSIRTQPVKQQLVLKKEEPKGGTPLAMQFRNTSASRLARRWSSSRNRSVGCLFAAAPRWNRPCSSCWRCSEITSDFLLIFSILSVNSADTSLSDVIR